MRSWPEHYMGMQKQGYGLSYLEIYIQLVEMLGTLEAEE